MKAPNAEQRRLLDLAGLDADLAKARHQRKNLPEDAELGTLATRLAQIRDDRAAAQAAADTLADEYARVETELTGTTDHLARDREQIESGIVSHKALTELQHEVTGLARRAEALETELLEVMEQQEATAAEAQRTEAALIEATDRELELVAERDAAAAAVERRIEDLTATREATAGEIGDDLLGVYQRLRDQGRVGAGLLRQRRCGACRMEIDPHTLSGIAAAAADDVVRCEECGAVMVRTEESGLPK
ncbi:zinc ribbon domain-containing protein [Gordonia shandongensis]|uniref:zinc ribbon domain-containing protein n=1 Tax=Gordonia shandongensis TaxID=376351 RepID=UPI0004259C72|nr:C4-type zinc ribbon domain-containing protein [Gordonia shandongensis]